MIPILATNLNITIKFPQGGAIKGCISMERSNRPVNDSINVEENYSLQLNSMMALQTEIKTHHHK